MRESPAVAVRSRFDRPVLQRCGGTACPPGTCRHDDAEPLAGAGHDFGRVSVYPRETAIQRQAAPPGAGPAPAPAPAAPAPAPAPAPAARVPGCHSDNCKDTAAIEADVRRGMGYVDRAIAALSAATPATETTRALDWYFRAHDPATVATVRTRLGCIRVALDDTLTNRRYGCDPDHPALAYVLFGTTPICVDAQARVCYTDLHTGTSPRVRAQTSIHECAHRVGMSLGRPTSVEDVYRFTAEFLHMGTEDLIRNSDSYALFAGAIAEGVPTTLLLSATASGGFAAPGVGPATWQVRLGFDVELQHPVLRIFNPTFGIGGTLIGETQGGPRAAPSPTSVLGSLRIGLRIADPRPGPAGGGQVSVFGGPAIAARLSPPTGGAAGAEAGLAVGYRWRWLDLSAGVGYLHDPTRSPGTRDLVTGSLNFTGVIGGDLRAQ